MTATGGQVAHIGTARRLRARHGIVMAHVMRDTRLSITARALYAVLCTYADANGTAFPGMETLRADLGVSERTYRRARTELVTAGYLIVTVRTHKSGRQDRTLFRLDDELTPAPTPGLTPAPTPGSYPGTHAGGSPAPTPGLTPALTPGLNNQENNAHAQAGARAPATPDTTALREHLATIRAAASG